MKKAFMFPGQGSQKLEMGKTLYDNFQLAKDIFEEANFTLEKDITKIIFNDDQALKITTNSQPALMIVSYAIYKVLEKEFDVQLSDYSYALGHSLGEYSALCISEALSFNDTLSLLKTRAEAMEKAVPNKIGGMIACLGLNINEIENLNIPNVEIANDNSEHQIVLSGLIKDLDLASQILLSNGAKRAIKLDVSGPFHSSYMTPAYEVLTEKLSHYTLKKPLIPIIPNVTAEPTDNPDEIKKLLADQIRQRVKWRESIEILEQLGISTVIEVGSGKVLSGLAKRINKNLAIYNIENIEDIENLKKIGII